MIKNVEGLTANLESHTFGDRNVLYERRIPVEVSGTTQEHSFHISHRAGSYVKEHLARKRCLTKTKRCAASSLSRRKVNVDHRRIDDIGAARSLIDAL